MRHVQGEVHSESKISVTAVRVKTFSPEVDIYQADMTAVHGLQRYAGAGTIQITLRNEIFEAFKKLLQDKTLDKSCLKHDRKLNVEY